MKQCSSELELEAFIRQHLAAAAVERSKPGHGSDAGGFDEPGRGGASTGVLSPGSMPGLGFSDSNALELDGSNANHLWWSDSVRTPHPAVSEMTGSRTASISASPRSTTSGNRALDSESGSDSESVLDMEGGPCKRGTKSMETKQIRRIVSNRESASRSRRRKHAQLSDLESQVKQLRSESASLFKQLTEANQHFTTAVADNRILKSDVETLRVKVKMAEDMVARSAMPCGLGHLGLAPFLNSTKMCQALDVLTVTGLDLPGPQVQNSTVQSTVTLESQDNQVSSEVTSCAADMWP